jgi:SAM-dependent methyltransferase
MEDLPSLGMKFDYINADEILYLLPDPVEGLRSMKSALKPEGILRANLHSSMQRWPYFRAQETFKMMGLMDNPPGELEAEVVRETMIALKDRVFLKTQIWNNADEKNTDWILVNPLLQADKGYTIPEMFSILKAADLDFISMLNWRHWEVIDLFKEPDNLPVFLGMNLPELSVEERLHLFELLHPMHRLLDFWCGHPNQAKPFVPVAEWTLSDWQKVQVHLHPQLKTPQTREDLSECIAKQRPFEFSRYLPVTTTSPITIESTMAACLLPLWERVEPVTFTSLVERWLKIRPFHPVTLEPLDGKTAFNEVKKLLSNLEVFIYVLLELPA